MSVRLDIWPPEKLLQPGNVTVVFVGDLPAVQTGWKVVSELLPDGIIELRARLEREHIAPKHQVERQKLLSVVLRRLIRLRR